MSMRHASALGHFAQPVLPSDRWYAIFLIFTVILGIIAVEVIRPSISASTLSDGDSLQRSTTLVYRFIRFWSPLPYQSSTTSLRDSCSDEQPV